MAYQEFDYSSPPDSELRQGEILADVWEHVPDHPATEVRSEDPIPSVSIRHPFLMVMSSDCDLFADFLCKQNPPSNFDRRSDPRNLQTVLLCDLFEEGDLKGREDLKSSKKWKVACQNENKRYHCVPHIETEGGVLLLDFKKMVSVAPEGLYGSFDKGVRRLGQVPPLYLEELMQRFYYFLGRISLPDRPDEERLSTGSAGQ